MVSSGKRKQVSLTPEDLCKLISKYSKIYENVDIDWTEVSNILYECLRQARRDPDGFRDYRHDLLSRRDYSNVPDTFKLKEVCKTYGHRSIIANTAARMVSIIKLSDLQVKKRTKGFTPPAFNVGLSYTDYVPDEYNAYKLLQNWKNIPGLNDIIYGLRNERNKFINKYKDPKDRRIILLDNNSSQGYCSGTVSITDLMGNIYAYPYLKDPVTEQDITYSNLSRLVGLKNSRDDDDPFAYLYKEDQFNGYKFRVVAIPDKDGKIRIIFQGSNDVQTISKGLHELFDNVARKLDGNYTYNQREWISNLIKNGWHKYAYIIGTDMSKYSDTLQREFILEILRQAGFTEDELRELDLLFSCPVLNLDNKILGDLYRTLASYQGQYGDFPLITIANLALQSMVMHICKSTFGKGRNAAVGDDSGMIFFKYIPEAMDIIIQVYGSVGVKINRLKTGELGNPNIPDGVVDFVKLRFDKDGLIPFFEPKPYFVNDFDQCIRDIYDSMFFTNSDKQDMFEILFDKEVSDLLMDKSIINGGINKRVIEPRDVNELIANKIMLTDLNRLKFGNFYTWLNQAYRELNENGFSWRDTVFSELDDCKKERLRLDKLLDSGDIDQDYYDHQLDSFIMMQIAKVSEFGSEFAPNQFHELIGNDPELIWRNHKDKEMRRPYNKELERLYIMIKSNESSMGRLKKKGTLKSRTVYKDKIEIDINGDIVDDWLDIAQNIKHNLIAFDNLDDYIENVGEAAKATNAYKIVSYALSSGLIIKRSNGYGDHYYIRFEGRQYALFNNRPYSTYPTISDEIKKQIPLLKDWNLKELIDYYNQF